VYLRPRATAELISQRSADLRGAAGKARRARALRRRGRYHLTARLAEAASAARGRWRELGLTEAEAGHPATREHRSGSPRDLDTARETAQTIPAPAP